MFFDLYESPAPYGEVIGAALRRLSVAPQAVEVKVDATMIRFEVQALLVASNSNALRRFHYFFEVEFTDGTTGDNGLIIAGQPTWPAEVVFFTDDGVEAVIPFHWGDDEQVLFREIQFRVAYSISATEFVTLADFAVNYVLDFLTAERLTFADLSVAVQGIINRAEAVNWVDSLTILGGNTIALSENVNISEVMLGGPAVIFSDAVRWTELSTLVFDFQLQPEFVTWTDALVVSVVAATDARPGAFIPGSALLGSST